MPVRRSVLALSALALALAVSPAPLRAEAPTPVAFEQGAFDAALAEGAPVLVEITAPWCPTCTAQKAVLAELLVDPKFADLVRLQVDFDSRKDVVRALEAQQQSTLIVYAAGEEVGRSVGETRPEAIAALLDSAY